MLRPSRANAWFGTAGRIAASDCIGQSVITAILFTGLGFGLAGRVPIRGTPALTAIYVTQPAVSAWWTRRHHYGPGERLLRTAA